MADTHGGPRAPQPGKLYPNRRDMAAQPPTQPAAAPKGQDYGKRAQTLAAQSVQPVAGAPATPQAAQALSGMAPGQVPTLMDPTARPHEPVTAGLSTGPGPGHEGLSTGAFGPPELSLLRAMYKKFQYEPLRKMLEQLEANL